MPDPATDQPDRDRPGSDAAETRPSDDTVELDTEPSLADELLRSDDPSDDDRDGTGDRVVDAAERVGSGGADATGPDEDDEYFEPHDQKRSRVTTGLLVALIFALGVLTGVLVGRLLTPAPAPQIVYVLNDAPSSAPPTSVPPASVPPSPTPPASR